MPPPLTQSLYNSFFPAWNKNSKTLTSLLNFISQNVTSVPPHKRIATFDFDGTIITEKPMFTETYFSYHYLCEDAESHPHCNRGPNYQKIKSIDVRDAAEELTWPQIQELILYSFKDWSQRDYLHTVREFASKVKGCYLERGTWKEGHPEHNRHTATRHTCKDLLYKPMLQLIRYLIVEHNFKVYIVSATQQYIVRGILEDMIFWTDEEKQTFSEHLIYIGSTVKNRVVIHTDTTEHCSSAEKEQKHSAPLNQQTASKEGANGHCDSSLPKELISTTSGRRKVPVDILRTDEFETEVYHSVKIQELYRWTPEIPLISFGNNANDLETFYYTMSGGHDSPRSFCALVNHDDSERDLKYDVLSGTHLGEEAKYWNWNIISMKQEWKDVF